MADTPDTTVQPNVHVFTDAQLQALIVGLKPGPSVMAQVGSTISTVNSDLLANLKALVADAEGAATGVHGAAKQLQTDVKANWGIILLSALTIFNTILILLPMLKVL